MTVDKNFYDYNIDTYELILKQLKNKLIECDIPQVYYCNAGTLMSRRRFEEQIFYSNAANSPICASAQPQWMA